jgi:hypothetical protein
MPATAQIIICLDSTGNLLAETTSANGQRKRVDLPFDFKQKNPEIMTALLERQDEIRRAELAALRGTQTTNISYVDRVHGGDLSRKVWGTNAKIFSATYRKHLQGERGNLASVLDAPPKTKETRETQAAKIPHLGISLKF